MALVARQTQQVQEDNLGPTVAGVTTLASASNPETTTQEATEIHFKIKERGTWKSAGSLKVNPSDTRELKRVAVKYMRKEINICDKNGRVLKIQTCYEDAIASGENTLYLIPTRENGDTVYSLTSGSVSNPQPISAISTNLASKVEGDRQEDIEQRHKKNRLTAISEVPVEDD